MEDFPAIDTYLSSDKLHNGPQEEVMSCEQKTAHAILIFLYFQESENKSVWYYTVVFSFHYI